MSTIKATKYTDKKEPKNYYAPDRFILKKDRKKPEVLVSAGNFSIKYGERLVESGRQETNKFIKVFLSKPNYEEI